MTAGFLDNWIAMALFAAGSGALSCIIDAFFVANGVYRRPSDGTVVAGLFCLVPAVASSRGLSLVGVDAAVVAAGMLAGVAFLLHSYFYFKALFELNDAVNAEVFNTLSVLCVPVLAFALVGERLAGMNYLAIVIAISGVLLLVLCQPPRLSSIVIFYLAASVVSISVMMVLQAWVLQHVDYATAVWLFSTTAFGAVLLLFGVPNHKRHRIRALLRRFGTLLVVVQLLEVVAVLASQRATDTGPSVSLVALLECALPLFVMAFCWLFVQTATRCTRTPPTAWRETLAIQTAAAPGKLASMALIVLGMHLVQG